MNVVVNGLMTNYQKTGSGKVLVFLHGWGDTSATFSKLIDRLQDQYTVLALDLPGFGGTQAPPNAWGLHDYVDFIAEWLKKINVSQVEAIVGHSYGGATAIVGLGSGGLKSKKLILLASAGIRKSKTVRKKLVWSVAKAGKVPLYLLSSSHRRKFRKKFYSTVGSEMLLVPHMELTFKRIIGEDVQAAARKIVVPTLLIYGNKDKDTSVAQAQLLKQAIAGSRLEIMNAGHFLHQEHPIQIAELITNFLKEGSDK